MNKHPTMIYWKGEKFWLGKLLEYPEIMTQGETLEELEENIRDVFKLMVRDDAGTENEMIKFEVILYWSDEDQAFISEIPELPGCAADGKTYQEVIANIELVIHEWIETARELGRAIPIPKGKLMYA